MTFIDWFIRPFAEILAVFCLIAGIGAIYILARVAMWVIGRLR